MRIKVLSIGILLFAFAIIVYLESPSIINKTLNSFVAKDSPVGAETLLRQIGFPSIDTITRTIEYSSLAMSLVGVGMILLGGMAKKKETKKVPDKTENEYSEIQVIHDEILEKPKEKLWQENQKSLEILQQRFAKGEISPSEFVHLKRFLE